MKVRLGYVALSKAMNDITTSSTITYTNYINKNYTVNKLLDVTKSNLDALKELLIYNVKNNIHFYRLTSKLVPLATQDKVSFEVKPGQKIAIVGETGSGKTTIANLMARFYDINSGEILIDDIDIRVYDLNTLRRQISIMQQDNYLFTDTIMNNLKYGNSKMTDKDVIKICKKLDLDSWINEFDKGYYTVLENHGNTLSDGQRQLISYIRILINDPKILVLDEATSKIDVKTESIIQKKINALLKDKTTITIAHRLSTIVNSDIIMLIKDKKVYEIGSHKELMKKKGEYYKLFSSQDNLI